MFNIKKGKDDELIFQGEFDLGVMGKFPSSKIEINLEGFSPFSEDTDPDEDDLKSGYYQKRFSRLMNIIKPHMSEEEKLKKLTEFYEAKQKEVIEHLDVINDRFLKYIIMDIVDCDYNFWQEDDRSLSSFIIPEKLPKVSNQSETLEDLIFERVQNDDIYSLIDTEYKTYDKVTPAREIIERYFPMIDTDKLVSSIYPDILVLEGDILSAQCSSDVLGGMFICSAYAEILPDFTFGAWDNH